MNEARLLTERVVSSTGAEQTRAAARLMSLIADDEEATPQVLADLRRAPSPHRVIGLTGPPGVGKSTLADALVREFRRQSPDRRVGVIAVDPSSPGTGGAILGDRVRMMRHAADDGVFIRSLATRGRQGGLTAGMTATIRVLGALGCDTVLLETVGVGQTEVDVRTAVDLVVVVLSAGFGDDIQLHKAGLLEIGGVYVVNKSDLPGAREFAASLEAMLALGREAAQGLCVSTLEGGRATPTDDDVPVLTVSAATNEGVPMLVELLQRRGLYSERAWKARREETERMAIAQAVTRRAVGVLTRKGVEDQYGDELARRVMSGEDSIDSAAKRLLRRAAEDADGEPGRGQ